MTACTQLTPEQRYQICALDKAKSTNHEFVRSAALASLAAIVSDEAHRPPPTVSHSWGPASVPARSRSDRKSPLLYSGGGWGRVSRKPCRLTSHLPLRRRGRSLYSGGGWGEVLGRRAPSHLSQYLVGSMRKSVGVMIPLHDMRDANAAVWMAATPSTREGGFCYSRPRLQPGTAVPESF